MRLAEGRACRVAHTCICAGDGQCPQGFTDDEVAHSLPLIRVTLCKLNQ